MGFFGTKKLEENVAVPPNSGHIPAANPHVQVSAPPPPNGGARIGIDHAIMLMRSLPTEKNVALVVTVLKTTLESLNIHVADIVADAGNRQQEIDARTGQLQAEITGLEQEIAKRAEEIRRLDAARAETSKVKEYLETDDIELAEDT
jgi:hypothetical protein